MAHQVPWNKVILETFIQEALLTKEEEWIMRTRVAGWTITQQADKLGMSKSSVDRLIRNLKKKYDNMERTNPLLPPRKSSAKEIYMDTH